MDCGYEETAEELVRALQCTGVEVTDLDGVVMVHDDHDHLGGLSVLKDLNRKLKCIPEYWKEDGFQVWLKPGDLYRLRIC